MNKVTGECQSGFSGGRSVVEQMFAIREIHAESREHNIETNLALIDIQHAYGRIGRKVLFMAMAELRRKYKLLVRITKMSIDTTV